MSTLMSLGDRMKEYERAANLHLTRRMPYIIRLDGVSFHTYTRGFSRPFDTILVRAMQRTLADLCKSIQGVVFGYTQSDEITLVLQDYKELSTAAWFDKSVQKICSVAAAKATMFFNRNFESIVEEEMNSFSEEMLAKYSFKIGGATFDARVFGLPESEVANCLIWRQQDAVRNSIQAVAQANYSERELHKKSTKLLVELLKEEKNINWNSYPTHLKRGTACYKVIDESVDGPCRPKWVIDCEIPIFAEDRYFIEKHLPNVI